MTDVVSWRNNVWRTVMICPLFFCVTTPSAQAPQGEFEVASIKRNPSGVVSSAMRTLPDGQVISTNMPLRPLLARAWGAYFVEEGLPSWMTIDRYDVVVKPPAGAKPDELRQMWRHLFAARMKLAAHLAPREVPSYALVLARRDGRLGPQLRPATLDCGKAGTQWPTPGDDVWMDAGQRCDLLSGSGRMTSGSALIDELANMLRPWAGRPVTNATRLDGRYAIDLRFSIPPKSGGTSEGTADAPEVFTAVREQLGLKLERSRTKVDVLVIDSIERPSED